VARDVARGNTNALQVVEVVKMEMNRTTFFANLLAGKISVKFLNFRILECLVFENGDLTTSADGVRVIVDVQMETNKDTVFSNLFVGKISVKSNHFRIL